MERIKYETDITLKLSNSYSVTITVLVAEQLAFPLILGTDFINYLEYDQNSYFVDINHNRVNKYDPDTHYKILRLKHATKYRRDNRINVFRFITPHIILKMSMFMYILV